MPSRIVPVASRIFEIVFAVGILILSLPFLAIAAISLKADSAGKVIFAQTRVGKNQKPFTMYKLRTMKSDTKSRASHEVAAAQITKVGQILRRTKLDELPQLVNVIRGDMSFVGPRPCLPSQSELLAERSRLDVFSVRPGITGPAQLAGLDMSRPLELAKADAKYISTRTVMGDLKLILQTAIGGGKGDAVKSS